MPLPTVADVRAYLRIETTVDDALIERLLAAARAAVEAYLRVPIEARAMTVTIDPTWAPGHTFTRHLAFPIAPIEGPVTVLDADGTELAADTYTVQPATGRITLHGGGIGFAGVPHVVTARAGLSLRPEYAVAIEPTIGMAILDWTADLYQRRNPAASYESGGGGVAVNYNETASKTMPSRVRVTLDPWRRVLV